MGSLTIDREKCNKDGLCVMACPTKVIQMETSKDIPEPTDDFKEYCLECGHCAAVCPAGALNLDWLNSNQCPPFRKALAVEETQVEQLLRSRRSIRNYKSKPVEREKLEKLLKIACCAPSAKNNQPWNWAVVEDPAETRRMAGMVIEWMRSVIEQNPEQAELRGFPRVVATWDAGEERICRGAPHIIVVHGDKDYGFGAEDCATALSYLELFAPAIGLGTCWGGYFTAAVNAYQPLFEALGLPADHKVFGAVMVGYPKFKYQRLPVRKPPRVAYI